MKNSFADAKLIDLRHIAVMIFTNLKEKENYTFYLKKDDGPVKILKKGKHMASNGVIIYYLYLDEDFEFGAHYELNLDSFSPINIDVSDAPTFEGFDQMFTYDGDDLGATYTKEKTTFNLWAPISLNVFLKIENEKGDFDLVEMKRTEKGVHRVTLKGDYLGRKYHYVVNNYSYTKECNDPYGKGVSTNSIYSVVVDTEKIAKLPQIKPKTPLNSYTDHIIYETHVRDFTEHKGTDIVHKGTYQGFYEEGRKTLQGNPAGLDYLKFIEVTTIQLQPLLDYQTVNDLNVANEYNWGYDPISFFSLEGSLSVDPTDPHLRLTEVRELVDTYHKNDLRVTLDVVYNHVFDYLNCDFEKVVPNYFFRRRNTGYISATSGCGNDFCSERPMARKAIIDSLKYLTKTFDFDGYRFDLMGLLDIDTVNQAYAECRKIKKDIIFYGEGWTMDPDHGEYRATIGNSYKLDNIAFFNDVYRDIMKGSNSTSTLNVPGYVGSNSSYLPSVVYALFATCLNTPTDVKRFKHAGQSLNFVECHDNHTLYDKLCASNPDDDESTILSRILLANTIVDFSYGIPFYHMGQEAGLSKHGLGNSYNICKVNNMSYKTVDERFDMVIKFKTMNHIRKENAAFFKETDMESIYQEFEVNLDCYPLIVISSTSKKICPNGIKEVAIIINNQTEGTSFTLDDWYIIYFLNGGVLDYKQWVQELIVPPLSYTILYR